MGNCGCITKTNKEDRTEFALKKPNPNINIAESYKQVVRIQAIYRGHLARKKVYEIRMREYNQKVSESLQQLASAYLSTKFKHLQAFNYDLEEDLRDPLFEQRVFKPVHQFESGGTYLGEW